MSYHEDPAAEAQRLADEYEAKVQADVDELDRNDAEKAQAQAEADDAMTEMNRMLAELEADNAGFEYDPGDEDDQDDDEHPAPAGGDAAGKAPAVVAGRCYEQTNLPQTGVLVGRGEVPNDGLTPAWVAQYMDADGAVHLPPSLRERYHRETQALDALAAQHQRSSEVTPLIGTARYYG